MPNRRGQAQAEIIESLIVSIEAEFVVALGQPGAIDIACQELRERLNVKNKIAPQIIHRLGLLLEKRGGAMATPAFELLREWGRCQDKPWSILKYLLATRDTELQKIALLELVAAVSAARLMVDEEVVEALAVLVESNERIAKDPAILERIAELLQQSHPPRVTTREPLLNWFLHGPSLRVQKLAAGLLDRRDQPADSSLVRQRLGDEAYEFLAPYLAYTRATHVDLLSLTTEPNAGVTCLPSLREAEKQCGQALLREIISSLGWERINLGLELNRHVGLSINESFPFVLSPLEASWLEKAGECRRVFDHWLIVAHGGTTLTANGAKSDNCPISRFRAYNLMHAEVLADILDISPLTAAKVRRILDRLDRITADYATLFAPYSDECAALPSIYDNLKSQVLQELSRTSLCTWTGSGQDQATPSPQTEDDSLEYSPRADSGMAPSAPKSSSRPKREPKTNKAPICLTCADSASLSPELARLVQMFEDPASLAEVRTLHGLKRYLHQQGLRLGFRLVEAGGATNRTVDLALAGEHRIRHIVRTIQYVDFEPVTESGKAFSSEIPYAVRVVTDGFARQLVFGLDKFPTLRIFCYGNEIHYYAAFGNHPAFIRVDYSPPLRGGMIDLEYFGISKYVLENHPAPALAGIRRFFLALEFDCQVESTRIHARYDKERTLGLDDLCRKAEALFRLTPYLMDIDWAIGSLSLNELAKGRVQHAWADFFRRWGVWPHRQFLTADGCRILTGIKTDRGVVHEEIWDGQGDYRDRFTNAALAGLADWVCDSMRRLGLTSPSISEEHGVAQFEQLSLEESVLRPLRSALSANEIIPTADGFQRSAALLKGKTHPARRMAEILSAGSALVEPLPMGMAAQMSRVFLPAQDWGTPSNWDGFVSAAIRQGRLMAPLERSLRFRTLGSINGYEVQQASLALRGESLDLFVLRDAGGMAVMAFYLQADARHGHEVVWGAAQRQAAGFDPVKLARLLRQNNYLTETPGVEVPVATAEMERWTSYFRIPSPRRRLSFMPGEQWVRGLRAAPGRAVGKAVLDATGFRPEDLHDSILITACVQPKEEPLLHYVAGLVCTGGSVLSHAGLLAVQLGKPSLVIPGKWSIASDTSKRIEYAVLEYHEEDERVGEYHVVMRHDFRERTYELREGDLVVIDADEGLFRVLGQERDVLVWHDYWSMLREVWRTLEKAATEQDILTLRGRRLHAIYHLEKLLSELTDPILARHAVEELLLNHGNPTTSGNHPERTRLLRLLLLNSQVGETVAAYVREIVEKLQQREQAFAVEALRKIPAAQQLYDILYRWLGIVQLNRMRKDIIDTLTACGLANIPSSQPNMAELDHQVKDSSLHRLRELRQQLHHQIASVAGKKQEAMSWRHLLFKADHLDEFIHATVHEADATRKWRERLTREDQSARQGCHSRQILHPADGGLALAALIGSKAANLAEIQRLLGNDLSARWFVVTDHAFREVLAQPQAMPAEWPGTVNPDPATLEQCIQNVLNEAALDYTEKSRWIQQLWEEARIAEPLAAEVAQAYAGLLKSPAGLTAAEQKEENPFVAVRSSGREEDTQGATWAGEFDTFLYVQGTAEVLLHIKRVWSGLWSPRAIHYRMTLGQEAQAVGGGVLVQAMINSRVAGVIQTINVAEGRPGEMVINVGLGLGEGIVSGTVGADLIVVEKEGDLNKDPLRFRYGTADKREQVVFDRHRGQGTIRTETRYHQRMRPALEYIELCELVRAAAQLETAVGYPLDIEFGIEGTRLTILQARPLPTYAAVLEASKKALKPSLAASISQERQA